MTTTEPTATEPTTTPDFGPTFDAIDTARLIELRAYCTGTLLAEITAIADALPSIARKARAFKRTVDQIKAEAEERSISWRNAADEDDPDLDEAVSLIVDIVAGVSQIYVALGHLADAAHPDTIFDALLERTDAADGD